MSCAERALLLIAVLQTFPMQTAHGQDEQIHCAGFDPARLEVKREQGRWQIAEGNNLIRDFGDRRGDAENALDAIKRNGLDHICFEKRPDQILVPIPVALPNTTVFVVRHAEKGTDVDDLKVPLTADGEKRAETLARMLEKSGVSVVYSSAGLRNGQLAPYTRTRETVNNYADKHGIPITYYRYELVADLAADIKAKHFGRKVLVAGHSDTVPELLKALGVKSPPSIGNEFDNLFAVTVRPDKVVSMSHLKYPIDHGLYVCKCVFKPGGFKAQCQ